MHKASSMEQSRFNKKIGSNLRRLRNAARMTQDEVAQSANLSRASIANMETGRQAMSAFQAMQLASALGLPSLDELFDMRRASDVEGDSRLFRPPSIEESTKVHLNAFMTRHGS